MHILLTGGSGYVGGFVAPALTAAGHDVTHLARRPPASGAAWVPWDLAAPPPGLPAADALVHLAFDHIPGVYRGGEGDDPARFVALNRDASRALFDAAGDARIVFLSSRAVYGDHRRGETLRETDPPGPESLYGAIKLETERALGARGASLRATGVYGGAPHKWIGLFESYLRGDAVPPRVASEVHGVDLAAAVLRLLDASETGAFNVSDLLLDRHDLLARVRIRTGAPYPPPPRAEGPPPGVMATARLRALGWRPGGLGRLDAFLAACFPAQSPDRPCTEYR